MGVYLKLMTTAKDIRKHHWMNMKVSSLVLVSPELTEDGLALTELLAREHSPTAGFCYLDKHERFDAILQFDELPPKKECSRVILLVYFSSVL